MANFNFNKVILGGRLSHDPELKQTQSGMSMTSFSVAVSRKPSKSQPNPESDFINCTAFGQTAEIVTRFFKKGSSICIVGRLQNDKFTDKEGKNRVTTKIMVDEVTFVDSKSDSAPAQDNTSYVPEAYTAPAPKFEELSDSDELPF